MTQVQLPQFTRHPECATALLTLDDAIALIRQGSLTIEGAQQIFPQRVWFLLPKAKAQTVLERGEN
jgi:hypothetical protein